MTTTDVMDRLKNVNPVEPERVSANISDRAFEEIANSILDSPAANQSQRTRHRSTFWTAPRLAVGLCAIVVVALGVALSGKLDLQNGDPGPSRAWAAELVRFAEESPLVLLDPDQWDVKLINQSRAGSGSINFKHKPMIKSDIGPWARLKWSDYSSLEEELDYLAEDSSWEEVSDDAPVLDTTAHVFETDNRGGLIFYTALWEQDGLIMYLDGSAYALDGFEQTLSQLQMKDVDGWLEAMPERVIKAGENHAKTVKEILRGISVPEGFSASEVSGGNLTNDRYFVVAQVTGTVACRWIAQWVEARDSGDEEAASEALTAMQGSRQWPALRGIVKEGDWAEVLWDVANTMSSSRYTTDQVALGAGQSLGCSSMGVSLKGDE